MKVGDVVKYIDDGEIAGTVSFLGTIAEAREIKGKNSFKYSKNNELVVMYEADDGYDYVDSVTALTPLEKALL
jgi:hypothetical protein